MKKKTRIVAGMIREKIHEVDPGAKVILYGSRARGDERWDSDWDILVLTDKAVTLEKERAIRNNLFELELDTGEPFSLFVYSKEEWETRQRITPFYSVVNKEGISL
jgi:predicted nucleotidyltransferase